MRIAGGLYRGRVLETPKGRDIRPTSDKVRLAVFNMLHSRARIRDAVVLDAFCGTGALAIEALSWGAAQALFIDKARESLELAKRNCAMLKIGKDTASFLLKDSAKIGQKPDNIAPASLVFLDPPYNKNLVPDSYDALFAGGWIAADALIVMETEGGFDEGLLPLDISAVKTYGDTKIMLGTVPEVSAE